MADKNNDDDRSADDFDFSKPTWSLYQVIHWIAFRWDPAPESEHAVSKFEEAERKLLEKWQEGKITPRGLEHGLGEPKPIPRDFGSEAEFDPLDNAIYLKDQWQPEAPWQKVRYDRDKILDLWPDKDKPQAEKAEKQSRVDDQKTKKRKRKSPYEDDDMPLVEEMNKLLQQDSNMSLHAAATQLADKTVGGGTVLSRTRRLDKRYKKKYPNWDQQI